MAISWLHEHVFSLYLAKSLWSQNKRKNCDQSAVKANCCITVGRQKPHALGRLMSYLKNTEKIQVFSTSDVLISIVWKLMIGGVPIINLLLQCIISHWSKLLRDAIIDNGKRSIQFNSMMLANKRIKNLCIVYIMVSKENLINWVQWSMIKTANKVYILHVLWLAQRWKFYSS